MKISSVSGYLQFVQNVEKTTEFYEKLGFTVAEKASDHAKVRLNWFWIEFVQAEKAEETVFAKDLIKDQPAISGGGLYICT